MKIFIYLLTIIGALFIVFVLGVFTMVIGYYKGVEAGFIPFAIIIPILVGVVKMLKNNGGEIMILFSVGIPLVFGWNWMGLILGSKLDWIVLIGISLLPIATITSLVNKRNVMYIQTEIDIFNISNEVINRVLEYFKSRNFELVQKSESSYFFNRGNKYFPENWKRIETEITVKIINDQLSLEISADTIGIIIGGIDKHYWDLEIATLESVIENNDYKLEEWKKFYRRSKVEKILFMLLVPTFFVIIIGIIIFVLIF